MKNSAGKLGVVLSAYPRVHSCLGCGERTVIFSVHLTDTDEVKDRCKTCAETMIRDRKLILNVSRSRPSLPETWRKNALKVKESSPGVVSE